MMPMSLTFLWPISKVNKPTAEVTTKKATSVLENSDKLYDEGYYEKCLDLLTNCEVILVKCETQALCLLRRSKTSF